MKGESLKLGKAMLKKKGGGAGLKKKTREMSLKKGKQIKLRLKKEKFKHRT